MEPLYYLSDVLDKHLGGQSTLRSLCQILPCSFRVLIHHLRETTPEVISHCGLTTWRRHIHLRTLEGSRDLTHLLCFNLSFELCTSFILFTSSLLRRGLSRIRPLGKEVVDVISKHVRVGEHEVHCCTLFTSCFEHQGLRLTTLHLLNQCVFNSTGIGGEKLRQKCSRTSRLSSEIWLR